VPNRHFLASPNQSFGFVNSPNNVNFSDSTNIPC
jgi:hypothetical protein